MKINTKAKKAAMLGVFGALAAVISVAENALPPIPMLPPGAKLGLSNILLMYIVTEAGLPYALAVAIFKSTAVLLTRGITAAIMSLAGGILSLLAVYIFYRFKAIGEIGLGVISAVCHNLGQLAVSLIITGGAAIYYLPALLIFAVISGSVTGIAFFFTKEPINKAINGGYAYEQSDN